MSKVRSKKPYVLERRWTIPCPDDWQKLFWFDGWRKFTRYEKERDVQKALAHYSKKYSDFHWEFRVRASLAPAARERKE